MYVCVCTHTTHTHTHTRQRILMDIFLADDPKNQYVTCLLSLYYASIKPLSRLLTLYVHIKAIKALLRLY